jgi:hypothetical protein
LYSQFTPDGGPLPLEVILKPKGNLILKVSEKKAKLKRLIMIF